MNTLKIKVNANPGNYIDLRAQFLTIKNNVNNYCLNLSQQEIESCPEEECLHFDMLVGKYRFSSTDSYQKGFFTVPIYGLKFRTP